MDTNLFTLQGKKGGDEGSSLEDIIQVINNVCAICPVKQDCLDSASYADKWHTVRGGLMPACSTSEIGAASMPASIRPAPEGGPYLLDATGQRKGWKQVESGICNKKIHIIDSFDKIHKTGQCLRCRQDTRIIYDARVKLSA